MPSRIDFPILAPDVATGHTIVLPGLGECRVHGRDEGSYNDVFHIQTPPGEHFIYKASQRPLEEEVARDLCRQLRDYVKELAKLGVDVPDPDQVRFGLTIKVTEGMVHLVEIAPFSGPSAQTLLSQAQLVTEACEHTRRMIRCFRPMFLASQVGEFLEVGIDPIPRNLCADGRRMKYIDFFFPKLYQTTTGMFNLEAIHPKDKVTYDIGCWRHYHKVGILWVFLIQLCRLRPELKRAFEATMLAMLSENRLLRDVQLGVSDYIDEFQKMDLDDYLRDIQTWTFQDIYKLRAGACELAYRGVMVQSELESFFSLSHFQHEALTDAKIQELRDFLTQRIRKVIAPK